MNKNKDKASRTAEQSAPPTIWRHIIIIVFISGMARLLYDLQLPQNILLNDYHLDSLVFHNWAKDIIDGTTANLAFFRAPLYPYVLAALYKIFGTSVWPVIIFQNLLGIGSTAISYLFAQRLFGSKTAIIAGIIVALYPTLIIYEGETLTTSLEVLLYTLSAYLIYLSVKSRSFKYRALAGIICGLAAITRPVILPALIIYPLVLFIKNQRRLTRDIVVKTIIFTSFVLIPILPVTFTNIIKGHEFVFISTQGGANFYIGNSARADGITVVALGPQYRTGKYEDNVWTSSSDEAERLTGRKMAQSEISSFWYSRTLGEMKGNLEHAAILLLKKFFLFWHGQEIININSPYYASTYSLLIKILLWQSGLNFPSGIMFPLMFLGFYYAVKSRQNAFMPAAFIMIVAVAVSTFFVCSRFRQPIIPLAIIFAAFAISEIINDLKASPRNLIVPLLLSGVLIIGLNGGGNIDSKENRSQFQLMLGNVYMEKEDYKDAILHMEKALEILPDNLTVYSPLATSYLRIGQTDKAREIYQKGISIFPTYPHFNFGLGLLAQIRGNHIEAKEYYHKALISAPDFAPALEKMGSTFEQDRQYDSALYYYDRLRKTGQLSPSADDVLMGRIRNIKRKMMLGQ